MTTTDIIGIISIIVTTALTIVSLFIAVKALKQSEKSIKLTEESVIEANRPYLVVYYEDIQVSSTVITYIVLKNFGVTGAFIDSVTCTPEMKNEKLGFTKNPFQKFNNHFIAPSQKFTSGVFVQGDTSTESIITSNRIFTINYHDSSQKTYTESFTFDEESTNSYRFIKAEPSSGEELQTTISKAFQELIRRNL